MYIENASINKTNMSLIELRTELESLRKKIMEVKESIRNQVKAERQLVRDNKKAERE
jgi:hypothetical protein